MPQDSRDLYYRPGNGVSMDTLMGTAEGLAKYTKTLDDMDEGFAKKILSNLTKTSTHKLSPG